MAIIKVNIKLEKGVKTRKVSIDNRNVTFDKDGVGETAIVGTMGDGSLHMLVMAITGPASAKMTTTLSCNGQVIGAPEVLDVSLAAEPYAADYKNFKLNAAGA